MITRPHDLAELRFAPVVLAIDACIEQLGHLSPFELASRVARVSDSPASTRPFREHGLLIALRQALDTHGWDLSLCDRGVRASHLDRNIVLGLPSSVRAFLDGPPA
jgi:hypothetical protein